MSRLQKKCLVVSSAFHGLLIVILLFGSALMPSPEESTAKTFKVYSSAAVSDAISSGGEPDAAVAPAPPAPAPPTPPAKPEPVVAPPAPAPTPKPHVELPAPKPVIEPPKIKPRIEPKAEEPVTHWYNFSKPKTTAKEPKITKDEPTPPAKHKVIIDKGDLALHKANANDSDARELREQRDRDRNRGLGREIAKTVTRLNKDLSTGTQVEMPGVGGGGEATVNYRDVIMNKYLNAWSPPADLEDNVPVVTATVTIARDGSVVSAHILTPAGNKSLDRSIENALQTVTFIEPFPASWKETERTVTVRFNLQLKRQTG